MAVLPMANNVEVNVTIDDVSVWVNAIKTPDARARSPMMIARETRTVWHLPQA
jgi:hypothetical protein